VPSAFLRVRYIRCTLATPKQRRRSPLVFHLVALALFLFSPRVSCLVLASSLSSSRSHCVLPLVFGSPLEDLTARVDPPSLRLPAGLTTRTSSEPISDCGMIFVSTSVMTYTTAYSPLDVRILKTLMFSITDFGSLTRSWPRHSENPLKMFLTCHFPPTPGMMKMKIP